MIESNWVALRDLSPEFLFDLMYGIIEDTSYRGKYAKASRERGSALLVSCAIMKETRRRGWRDGWWEDESVIEERLIEKGLVS